MKNIIFPLVSALTAFAAVSAATAGTAPSHLDWWTQARFGMFIHFGLYSLPARHEWVKSIERMSERDYARYFERFNPDLFDAREWARSAKRAGMKYVVLTTKHHEGFCLFDSKYTGYKSTKTPFGRDIVREFVDAVRAEGLRVGFYYSLPDWHHPDFTVDRYHPRRPVDCGPWDPRGRQGPEEPWTKLNAGKDMARYREYLFNQVTELLTSYGKIDLMWFDFTMTGPRTKTPDDWHAVELLKLVRRLQPGIIVNDRLGLTAGDRGDFVTPEQELVEKAPERDGRPVPWEVCQTFSGSWGYNRDETSWKTPEQLIAILVNAVSHGGNLIMNVGPTARGDFDFRARERLAAFGRWMHANGRSIYGCTAAPDGLEPPRGTALTWNPGSRRLYLHLFEYPVKRLKIGFFDRIEYAQLLSDGSEIRKIGSSRSLEFPVPPPRGTVPVVEIWMKGDGRVTTAERERDDL